MEHIVQFAIGIDDEAIKKMVRERGYDDVVNSLKEDAKNYLANTYYGERKWGGEVKIRWDNVVEKMTNEFIEENKDVIIEKAAEKLAESYKRTKKYKEAMEKALEE